MTKKLIVALFAQVFIHLEKLIQINVFQVVQQVGIIIIYLETIYATNHAKIFLQDQMVNIYMK